MKSSTRLGLAMRRTASLPSASPPAGNHGLKVALLEAAADEPAADMQGPLGATRRLGPPHSAAEHKLVGYDGLSAMLNVGIPTLRSMVSRGQLPSIKLGPRLRRFDVAEVQRWIEAHRVGGGQ